MNIHKRFPPAIARPLASSAPSTSRVRSNSASARTLYTSSSSPLPFTFFDAPGVPSPARPGSTNLAVSTRLAAEAKAELESGQTSQHQHSPHGQSQTGNSSGPPPYSLAFSSGNAQSDPASSGQHLQAHHPFLFPNYFPYGSGSGIDGWLGAADTATERAVNTQKSHYYLDVGAYGIPKHSRKGGRVAGRDGFVAGSGAPCNHAGGHAVQVGEDAYFISENAMGVADGVGGWSKARKSGTHIFHSRLSLTMLLTAVSQRTRRATRPRLHSLPTASCTTAVRRSRRPWAARIPPNSGALPGYTI